MPMLAEALNLVMRWLHICSVAILIGGIVYARLIVAPALNQAPLDARSGLAGRMAAGFRPWVYAAMGALLISGLFNVFTHPGHTARYHTVLGIKFLLVLHVFAVALLIVSPSADPQRAARRPRQMAGVAISGLIIIALSAYLKRVF